MARAPKTIGPYRVLGALGRGGMGMVYRAVRDPGGDEVAVKTVLAPNECHLPAIRREIRALSLLRHPGIAEIIEAGTDDGVPWYSMVLVRGRTLAEVRDDLWGPSVRRRAASEVLATTRRAPDWTSGTLELGAGAVPAGSDRVERSGPRPPPRRAPEALPRVLTTVRSLCSTLSYLHGEGRVHRDLKPANVIVRADDGVPVLVDFGLLGAFGNVDGRDAAAMAEGAGGTLEYMAPEVIAGDDSDARADLYALGCILYELVTGRPPFADSSVKELLRAHLSRSPLPPSELVAGLPPDLDDLVLHLLAKRPRDRLGYAADVAMRLTSLGATNDDPWRGTARAARPYLYRPALAGRQQEIAALEATMRERWAGSDAAVVLLEGESGVGKTRLCLDLGRRAGASGARVLFGGGAALAGPGRAPIAPLSALARPLADIADVCRSAGPVETHRLLRDEAKLLARFAPELAALPGVRELPEPPDLPADATRALVAHGLAALFVALAVSSPVLLVVDDIQWADGLTLAFLERVVASRAAGAARLFVIATLRTGEPDAPLAALRASPGVASVCLDRLDEAAVACMVEDMLAASPGRAFVRALAVQSEGNPLFVAEYLRAAADEGLLRRDAAGRWRAGGDGSELSELDLPRTIHALIGHRLSALGADARRVVGVAAVLGREADPALVGRVAGMNDETMTRAIVELCARHIVDEQHASVRLSHDKIREVAYDALEDEARIALHRTAADEIEARAAVDGPSAGAAEAVAHHRLAAGDDPGALAPLLAAADLARSRHDNERAAERYRAAVSILTSSDRPTLERELVRGAFWSKGRTAPRGLDGRAAAHWRAHTGLGDVLTTTGRADDALAEYALARSAIGDGDTGAQAELLGRIGAAHFAKGDLLGSKREVEAALRQLGVRLPESKIGLIASIGRSAALCSFRRAVPRSLVDPEIVETERLRVRLLNRLAYVSYSFDFMRTLDAHGRALCAAERIATTADAAETFSHHGPVMASLLPRQAARYALRAVDICRREGHVAMHMQAEFMAGMCFLFRARWDEALLHFSAAIELYDRVGDVGTLETAHENSAYAHLYRGAHDDAAAHAQRALVLSETAGDQRGIVTSMHHLSTAWLRLGDVERAGRLAARATEQLAALDDHVVAVMVHTSASEVARAEGRSDEAWRASRQAVDIADRHALSQEEVVTAYHTLVEECVESRRLDALDAAERALRRAKALARRHPAHRGLALRAEARLLALKGDVSGARARLAAAVRALRSLAMWYELGRTWEIAASIETGEAARLARRNALEMYRKTRAAAATARLESAVAQIDGGTSSTTSAGSSR